MLALVQRCLDHCQPARSSLLEMPKTGTVLIQFAKSGLKESLNRFFWDFSLHLFGYFGLLSSLFVSVSVCFTAVLSMAAPDRNVQLKDCVDGSRGSKIVSVNPFL